MTVPSSQNSHFSRRLRPASFLAFPAALKQMTIMATKQINGTSPPFSPSITNWLHWSHMSHPQVALALLPISHQSPMWWVNVSIRKARSQPEEPPAKSMRANRYQMGAFMTTASPNSVTTVTRRISLSLLRKGHRQTATNVPNQPATGVLLAQAKTIMVDEIAPTTAASLALPRFHSQSDRGKTIAPNDPAKMEC